MHTVEPAEKMLWVMRFCSKHDRLALYGCKKKFFLKFRVKTKKSLHLEFVIGFSIFVPKT